MLDVLMIASTVGFFAACLAYQVACQRLRRDDPERAGSDT